MRISAKQAVLAAIVAGLGVGATVAHAATPGIDPNGTVAYLVDKDFNVVKSGTGLCWQNGYWTPANAIAECDGTAKGAPAGAKITLAADTLFAFNKAELSAQAGPRLDKLADFLKQHPAGYPNALLDVYNPPADFATPRGLPMTYLIAPDGTLLGYALTGAAVMEKLALNRQLPPVMA